MNHDSAPLLSDHAYDGIQEYDNPLPGWWSFLFAMTFVFSIFYWIYFHLGTEGRTIQDEHDRYAAQIIARRFGEIGTLAPTREVLMAYKDESKWMVYAQALFQQHCASCHGAQGQGNVGPNLTDDYWKNVNKIEDLVRVIENGAANGAMPSFRNRLSHVNDFVLVAAYVASLRGQDLPSPRPQEGKEIPPW
ncbi:MAG TPA: cbb3-type cytochrome c oxidase N-terminal domain-containing protein [Pirellulaceae bacterium]|nr:cbb3-type cytochrome c oxidase N-terminal domain-containing protein [Pirellulaceae bacterium]